MKINHISVVIPMLNESRNIVQVIEDIALQDFSGAVEVFVADGGSTDGSRELLFDTAQRTGVNVTLIENPKRLVAHGLNACIQRANGDLIVRVDCRARLPHDYLSRLAACAEETDAWNVGAVVEPIGRTEMERAVACAMETPFGGIHWTRNDGANEPIEVDTVYLGAYRPVAFEKVGLFDASFVDNHDEEFNLRVRKAGGRIVLDPTLRIGYIPAGSFRGVMARYFPYGFYKPAAMRKHRQALGARSLVPSMFLCSLALLAATSVQFPAARRLLAAEIALYGAAAATFAATSVVRRRESWSLFPRILAVFPTFHLSYGVGMVAGWLRRQRPDEPGTPPRGAAVPSDA
jgi:glycosyltransferase involved in cell wall biosynthesis